MRSDARRSRGDRHEANRGCWGGISLVLVLTPILLMSLADAGLARLLAFIFLEFPAMFVDYVAGDQGRFWMTGVLAWILWGSITYALLWLIDVRAGSSSSKHA